MTLEAERRGKCGDLARWAADQAQYVEESAFIDPEILRKAMRVIDILTTELTEYVTGHPEDPAGLAVEEAWKVMKGES